jgi:hypothetical protein
MLVDNESRIIVENTNIENNWTAYPETLGDVSIISILGLIVKRIKMHEFNNKIKKNDDKITQMIKEINLIDKLVSLLKSESNTKKDVSLLILYYMTLINPIFKIMLCRDFIEAIVDHINEFKNLGIRY